MQVSAFPSAADPSTDSGLLVTLLWLGGWIAAALVPALLARGDEAERAVLFRRVPGAIADRRADPDRADPQAAERGAGAAHVRQALAEAGDVADPDRAIRVAGLAVDADAGGAAQRHGLECRPVDAPLSRRHGDPRAAGDAAGEPDPRHHRLGAAGADPPARRPGGVLLRGAAPAGLFLARPELVDHRPDRGRDAAHLHHAGHGGADADDPAGDHLEQHVDQEARPQGVGSHPLADLPAGHPRHRPQPPDGESHRWRADAARDDPRAAAGLAAGAVDAREAEARRSCAA